MVLGLDEVGADGFETVLFLDRVEDGEAVPLSFRVCQTEWLEREDRHLNFLRQSGRSHSKGCSPVCKRRCALRLYFFEKDL